MMIMDHFQDYNDHRIECDLIGLWAVFPRHAVSIFRFIGVLDRIVDLWVPLARLLAMRRDLGQVLQKVLNNLEVRWFSDGGPILDLRVDQPVVIILVRVAVDLRVNDTCLVGRRPGWSSDGRIFDGIAVHGCQFICKFFEHVLKRVMMAGAELGWPERT